MEGERVGRLLVVGPAESRGAHKRWACRCDCGASVEVWQLSLRRGTTRSCGCLKREETAQRWAAARVPGFWKRVRRGDAAECWNWTGYRKKSPKNPQPYGVLGWKGRLERAHRVAFELERGEIPAGAMVLHRCDNTLCCNPAHLYVGDHDRNMQDMVERGRRKRAGSGESNGRSKLTQEQVDEIRSRYSAGGVSQQALADEFGISQNAVSKIVRNMRYRE